MQSLNVALGGTLYQDLKEQLAIELNHTSSAHKIEIKAGTLLHKIIGKTSYVVNTFHHQAIKTLGDGLVTSATAPDGIVESVEYPAAPFCIGVEWHPEFLDCDEDAMLFQAFIEAARQYKFGTKQA
jgi:putative glutamine amidotransferase